MKHQTAKANELPRANMQHLKLFTGNANPELAQAIANHLGISLGELEVKTFSDGEVSVEIKENVRGMDCFVVQPTSPPSTNTHIMELLIMIDALRRSSAKRITAVIPY
jgi:ribose-phosphate pyrophosphokinase